MLTLQPSFRLPSQIIHHAVFGGVHHAHHHNHHFAQDVLRRLGNLEKKATPQVNININIQDLYGNNALENGAKEDQAADQAKIDKMMKMIMSMIRAGNVDLAMMLFAQIEGKEASKLTKTLTEQLMKAQGERRNLTDQLSKLGTGEKDQKETHTLNNQISDINSQIQLLTSMIKEANDQKNRTFEFASNFQSSEHQTKMNIVRK